MAGPGDAVGAEHAFTHRAQLLHRSLAALIADVDAELDATNSAIEGAPQHHVLHPPIEARAAELRPIVSAADLQHLGVGIDTEKARHAGQLTAFEQDEGAVVRVGRVARDALIETVRPELAGIDVPDLAVLGAGGSESLAIDF